MKPPFFCAVGSVFCPIQTTTLVVEICNLQSCLYIAGYLLGDKVALMDHQWQIK